MNSYKVLTVIFLVGLIFFFLAYLGADSEVVTITSERDKALEALNRCTTEITSQSNKEAEKERLTNECLDYAYDTYMENWLSYCKINGIKITKGNCIIPIFQSNEFNSQYQRSQELCIQRYK